MGLDQVLEVLGILVACRRIISSERDAVNV